MQKILYVILCLLLAVSCARKPQLPVYHPKLIQIDSILQHDSFKWKNLFRGEAIPDVFLEDVEGVGFSTLPDSGEWIFHGATKKFYSFDDVLRSLDDTSGERGMRTLANRLLFLLKHFPKDSLTTEADCMYYDLLKMEALVKDYIAQKKNVDMLAKRYWKSDSTFLKVVDYYDSLGDKPMQMRAHTLLALFQKAWGEHTSQAREHLIAIRYAQEVGDEEWQAINYRFLGKTYFYANIYQKADSIYRLAELMAMAQKDTTLWMESIEFRLKAEKEMGLRLQYFIKKEDGIHQNSLQRIRRGLDLAREFGSREHESRFALLLGEEYMRHQRFYEGYLEKALHYGKMADSLNNGGYFTGQLLAKAYVEAGHTDSAAVYFNRVLGNEWREKGPVTFWVEVVYDPSNREKVAAVETELQKEWQQERYENSLLHHRYLVVYIVMAGVVLALFLHGYHRRRYRKQSAWLAEQQRKAQTLHAALQEGLKKQEEEVARLQEELNQQKADADARVSLEEKLAVANESRDTLALEAMKQSLAYHKVQLIMADFRWKEESDHKLTEDDWQELQSGVDACYNKVLARLTEQYQLDERELCICCLSLLDVPVVHIAHLIGYTRPVIYKAEQKILQKMGRPYEKGLLRKLLKTI